MKTHVALIPCLYTVGLNNCDVSYVSNLYEMPFTDKDNDFIPYSALHNNTFLPLHVAFFVAFHHIELYFVNNYFCFTHNMLISISLHIFYILSIPVRKLCCSYAF